jgi:hypothetical protein
MGAGTEKRCWGIVWRSNNSLDGKREFLQWDRDHSRTGPVLFETRRQAREYRDKRYGYIKGRADLKAMGARIERLRKAWWRFVENVIILTVIAIVIGLIVFLWWLDHVRFTF